MDLQNIEVEIKKIESKISALVFKKNSLLKYVKENYKENLNKKIVFPKKK